MTNPTQHAEPNTEPVDARLDDAGLDDAGLANAGFAPINAALKAGDQIYDALRLAILDMRLAPGCPVSETDLGEQMGASRTPVREALARLREEGLILTYPSRGNFVAPLSGQRILEAQFLREAIEVACVERVTHKGLTDDQCGHIRDNLAAQDMATKALDHARFHRLDDQFHGLIALATGLDRAALVLSREKIQLDRLRVLALRKAGHLNNLLAAHRAIFQALIARDAPRAVDLTRAHSRTVLDELALLTSQHSEYFVP